MPTIVGVFRHSGDADLAAAHLREAYALTDAELEWIGPGDTHRLAGPAPGPGNGSWQTISGVMLTPAADTGLQAGPAAGMETVVARRWGDQVWRHGYTLVVSHAADVEQALAMAAELRRSGADPVDMIQQ